MDVPPWVWAASIVALLVVFAVDLVLGQRHERPPRTRDAAVSIAVYVALGVAFGAGLTVLAGGRHGGEFFAGYLLEYSLSVDNLFVFLLLMTSFAVPSPYQRKVLLVGIALALVFRGGFIAAGAAAIHAFSFTFYIFGAFLLFTAVRLARHRDDEPQVGDSRLVRLLERVVPTSREYHGSAVTAVVDGRRVVTPMLLVMVAIGSTDVLFALDSIPAIFGVTQQPYIVFMSNAFALLGLRQLYFLLGALLERLTYLSLGLSVILGFIGVKLVLEALHAQVHAAPQVPVSVSLAVIVVVMAVTVVASLRHARREEERAGAG